MAIPRNHSRETTYKEFDLVVEGQVLQGKRESRCRVHIHFQVKHAISLAHQSQAFVHRMPPASS
jgi:hypothetical protein